MRLLNSAAERREAKRQLGDMLVVNRAMSGDEEPWNKLREALDERMHTGLTFKELPAPDPNRPPPKVRPFHYEGKK